MTTPTQTELALAKIAQGLNTAAEHIRSLPTLALPVEDDAAAAYLIRLARLSGLMDAVADQLNLRLEASRRTFATRLDSSGNHTVRVDGGVINLAESFALTPTIADLLPEGVKADDARYAATIARCESAATARLIHAMRGLPAYSGLVSETYDEVALAEELCGDDAPRNEGGVPIVPAALAPFLTVTREVDIVLTDPSGKEIGGGE